MLTVYAVEQYLRIAIADCNLLLDAMRDENYTTPQNNVAHS